MSIPRRPGVARRLVLLLALAGVVLVVAAPATASSKPTTGSRIGLFVPPTTFAANAPFYVRHGFSCAVGDAGCISTEINGTSGFTLYVDGVLQGSGLEVDVGDGAITKWHLTNFPDGLPAGVHTLTGVWNVNGTVTQTLTATIAFS